MSKAVGRDPFQLESPRCGQDRLLDTLDRPPVREGKDPLMHLRESLECLTEDLVQFDRPVPLTFARLGPDGQGRDRRVQVQVRPPKGQGFGGNTEARVDADKRNRLVARQEPIQKPIFFVVIQEPLPTIFR